MEALTLAFKDSAQSETPSMHGDSMRENVMNQKSNMHVAGESDGRTVPLHYAD